MSGTAAPEAVEKGARVSSVPGTETEPDRLQAIAKSHPDSVPQWAGAESGSATNGRAKPATT